MSINNHEALMSIEQLMVRRVVDALDERNHDGQLDYEAVSLRDIVRSCALGTQAVTTRATLAKVLELCEAAAQSSEQPVALPKCCRTMAETGLMAEDGDDPEMVERAAQRVVKWLRSPGGKLELKKCKTLERVRKSIEPFCRVEASGIPEELLARVEAKVTSLLKGVSRPETLVEQTLGADGCKANGEVAFELCRNKKAAGKCQVSALVQVPLKAVLARAIIQGAPRVFEVEKQRSSRVVERVRVTVRVKRVEKSSSEDKHAPPRYHASILARSAAVQLSQQRDTTLRPLATSAGFASKVGERCSHLKAAARDVVDAIVREPLVFCAMPVPPVDLPRLIGKHGRSIRALQGTLTLCLRRAVGASPVAGACTQPVVFVHSDCASGSNKTRHTLLAAAWNKYGMPCSDRLRKEVLGSFRHHMAARCAAVSASARASVMGTRVGLRSYGYRATRERSDGRWFVDKPV